MDCCMKTSCLSISLCLYAPVLLHTENLSAPNLEKCELCQSFPPQTALECAQPKFTRTAYFTYIATEMHNIEDVPSVNKKKIGTSITHSCLLLKDYITPLKPSILYKSVSLI